MTHKQSLGNIERAPHVYAIEMVLSDIKSVCEWCEGKIYQIQTECIENRSGKHNLK